MKKLPRFPEFSGQSKHCVKNVPIRSFFWPAFSCIRMRKSSVFGHFSRSEVYVKFTGHPKCRLYVCFIPSPDADPRMGIAPPPSIYRCRHQSGSAKCPGVSGIPAVVGADSGLVDQRRAGGFNFSLSGYFNWCCRNFRFGGGWAAGYGSIKLQDLF